MKVTVQAVTPPPAVPLPRYILTLDMSRGEAVRLSRILGEELSRSKFTEDDMPGAGEAGRTGIAVRIRHALRTEGIDSGTG